MFKLPALKPSLTGLAGLGARDWATSSILQDILEDDKKYALNL